MSSSKKPSDKITKEIALFVVPLAVAYLFIIFYEAGYAAHFSIPIDLISVNITQVMLTNRFTLVVTMVAFLWIGLYYNILPSTNSPFFKLLITVILGLSLALGITFGRSDATSKTQFLISNTHPESVILKIYDDKIITAPIDIENKIVYKSFSIQKIGEIADTQFHLQNVGPLRSQ